MRRGVKRRGRGGRGGGRGLVRPLSRGSWKTVGGRGRSARGKTRLASAAAAAAQQHYHE